VRFLKKYGKIRGTSLIMYAFYLVEIILRS